MSAGQCLPINLAFPTPNMLFAFLLLLSNDVGRSNGLRLTHMNAPLVADLREEMELHCHFDMGMEDLYAVKWYKDDQEFFRYMPRQKPSIMTFPVAGVHLVSAATNCSHVQCKVRLKELTRDHSGGAYRCEISTEAPTFRLASETHNITVAAPPRENPRIEGLTSSYSEGDIIEAKCVSGPADPAPILSWLINEHQAPLKTTGEMTSSEADGSGLVSRTLSLTFVADRKQSREEGHIKLECRSSLPGVPLKPQSTIMKIPIRTPNQPVVINNQKLHWQNSQSAGGAAGAATIWDRFLLMLPLTYYIISR